MIVVICLIICLILVLYIDRNIDELYDYDKENPNALISGCSVAGTVYASYPGNTPGLGWIL